MAATLAPSRPPSAPPSPPVEPAVAVGRDELIDIVRAGALGVVVVYHWVFTVVRWHADGPHASNPIGSTRGLWLATWVLQVMPLFFVVGGAVHAKATDRGSAFVRRRLGRLTARRAATHRTRKDPGSKWRPIPHR